MGVFEGRSPGGTTATSTGSPRDLVVRYGISLALVLCLTYGIYRHECASALHLAQTRLEAASSILASDLRSWIRERKGDVLVASRMHSLRMIHGSFRRNRPPEEATRKELVQRLKVIESAYDYESIQLLSRSGEAFVSTHQGPPGPGQEEQLREVFESGETVLSPIYESNDGLSHVLDLYAPMRNNGAADGTIIGAILLRTILERHAFVPIERSLDWASSVELHLVERLSGHATVFDLFGTEPRPLSAALTHIARSDTAGLMASTDDDGSAVYADFRKVDGAPWSVVVKVSRNDVFAAAYRTTAVAFLLLLAMGALLTTAITRVQRRRAEHAIALSADRLRQSEDELRDLYVGMQDGAIRTSLSDGKIVAANPAMARILDYPSPNALVGVSMKDAIWNSNDERDLLIQILREKGFVSFRSEWKQRNGTLILVEGNARLINGRPGGPHIEGVVRDVTAKAAAEAALIRSEATLAQAGRLAKIGAWERNLKTGELIWSAETYRMYEMAPDGKAPSFADFVSRIHPEDRPRVIKALEDSAKDRIGRPYSVDFRVVLPSGTIKYLHSQGEYLNTILGEPERMFGVVQDITERHAVEAAIKKSEAILAQAGKLAQVGGLDAIPSVTGTMTWTTEMYRIFERDPSLPPLSPQEFITHVHPDDRDRIAALTTEIMTVPTADHYSSEFRIVLASGRLKHVDFRAEIERDANNRAVRVRGVVQDVTGRKEMEQRLTESEEDFKSVFLRMQDAYIRTAYDTGTILKVNPSFLALYGYDNESELLGKFAKEILYTDPAERAALLTSLKETGVSELRLHGKRRDGRVMLMEARVRRVAGRNGGPDTLESVVRDITARSAAEEALRRSESTLAQAGRLAKIGAWERNLHTGELIWSDETFRIYERERTSGAPNFEELAQCVHPEDRERVVTTLEASRKDWSNKPYTADFRALMPSGAVKHLHTQGEFILDSRGQPERIFGVVQDITDRKQIEEQLRKAGVAAAQATKAKSEFLANVSHEIRTPLNVIGGLSHLALQTELKPKQRDYLEKISKASSNLAAIIENVLDFSKIEAGKVDLEATEFSVAEVLSYVASMVTQKAQEKGLQLQLLHDSLLSDRWLGDPLRLGQVLLNLAGNAVKFTESGRITISVDEITRDSVMRRSKLRFSVTDTGMGISDEQMEKLFRPFTQADGSITRKFGGTGLGLAIANQLVGLMGGNISAVSKPGAGSTFEFTLELPYLERGHVLEFRRVRVHEKKRDGASGSVLVVDDHEINQLVASEILKAEGYAVTVASDGRQALSILERPGTHFDVILMDLQMPELDGYETSGRIRAMTSFVAIPIVAMTANALAEEGVRCREAGMNDFVTKPIDPFAIVQTVAKWVESARQARQNPFQETPALEISTALKRLGGNYSLFLKLMRSFHERYRSVGVELRGALAAGDVPLAVRLAHGLKGAAGNLAAEKLHKIASTIEDSLKGGRTAEAEAQFTHLDAALAELLDQTRPMAG